MYPPFLQYHVIFSETDLRVLPPSSIPVLEDKSEAASNSAPCLLPLKSR
uniref:Uncharacterized protein n=1 Tax=Anguilla anguilla TaxID=7936 RepID=A0A0E9RNR5_ANGAN